MEHCETLRRHGTLVREKPRAMHGDGTLIAMLGICTC